MIANHDFTAEEWDALVRSPMVAATALCAVAPGGLANARKKAVAALDVVRESAATQYGLVGDVASGLLERAEAGHNPLHGFEAPPGDGTAFVNEMQRVNRIVTAKAAPGDATSFRKLIVDCVDRAAATSEHGGFLRRAKGMTEPEQEMVTRLKCALSPEAAEGR